MIIWLFNNSSSFHRTLLNAWRGNSERPIIYYIMKQRKEKMCNDHLCSYRLSKVLNLSKLQTILSVASSLINEELYFVIYFRQVLVILSHVDFYSSFSVMYELKYRIENFGTTDLRSWHFPDRSHVPGLDRNVQALHQPRPL